MVKLGDGVLVLDGAVVGRVRGVPFPLVERGEGLLVPGVGVGLGKHAVEKGGEIEGQHMETHARSPLLPRPFPRPLHLIHAE